MKCHNCRHEDNYFSDRREGHPSYGDCKTEGCKCSELVYGCEFPRCGEKSQKQYRDEYQKEEDPFLCSIHDELKDFIERCVRGALRKI